MLTQLSHLQGVKLTRLLLRKHGAVVNCLQQRHPLQPPPGMRHANSHPRLVPSPVLLPHVRPPHVISNVLSEVPHASIQHKGPLLRLTQWTLNALIPTLIAISALRGTEHKLHKPACASLA